MTKSQLISSKFSRGNLISFKAVFILFLVLLILVPLLLVWNTINHRRKRHEQAIQEISQAWSSAQQIVGPVLVLPYSTFVTDKEGKTQAVLKTVAWLPELLEVAISVEPEVRYRGIFEAVVYKADLEFKGSFELLGNEDLAQLNLDKSSELLWEAANISLGISDVRRLKSPLILTWNETPLDFSPGSGMLDLLPSGIHATSLKLKSLPEKSRVSFAFNLHLDGSKSLSFLPFGKNNSLSMRSTWPHPSFIGSFLPEKRDVSSTGFSANWDISYFGRSYPQHFTSDQLNTAMRTALESSSFGVRFIQPADAYHQSERSVKYGILFIFFTFMVYFLFELISGARIHIFQYALVGIALCTFFLLLISLAEHIGFSYAYWLGAFLVICQISLYSYKIIKTLKGTAIISAVLAALYLYLYVVLQLEDYALLIGASGLFLALGVIMFVVRNVDWYSQEN